MKNIVLSLLFFSIFSAFFAHGIGYAEELSISGNGSESENEVQVSQNNDTNVELSNVVNATNDVSVTNNTGGNSASDNTGGNTDLTTGDVSSDVQIANSGNLSAVSQDCCPTGGGSITVSGNGSGSGNIVTSSHNNTTTITLTNTARITNTFYGSVVTGNNIANGNVGNTTIRTGDIYVNQQVTTGPFNMNYVSAPRQGNESYKVNIAGNGSNSRNGVTFYNDESTLIATNNASDIHNSVLWDLITGNNAADWNVGNVSIHTGDIESKLSINNGPININSVTVDCCKEKKDHVTPPSTGGVTSNPPSNNPGSGSSGDGGRGGDVLGQAIGHILPATGTNWLFLALVGNVAMFFLGMYLRLRSGRSPGFAVAI